MLYGILVILELRRPDDRRGIGCGSFLRRGKRRRNLGGLQQERLGRGFRRDGLGDDDLRRGLLRHARVACNVAWTGKGVNAVDPDTGFISPGTQHNRYQTYYGDQTATFSNYSNVSGRTILSGFVTASISSASPANYQSTTDMAAAYTGSTIPDYASGLANGASDTQVQHTVSSVAKPSRAR